MRRAPLHWPLRSLTPASLVCAVSKLETLAMTASIATLSLSLINQNPELCDAIENPNMIYYRRIAFDNNHFNEIGQVFCNSTSELRNATDHCHCQVRPYPLTKKGCHLTTIYRPEFLNLVEFYFPGQSWQDDKKLSQPHDSNRDNEKTEIVLNPFTRMRANEQSSQIKLCLPHQIKNINQIEKKRKVPSVLFCSGNGFSFLSEKHDTAPPNSRSLIFNFSSKVAQFHTQVFTYVLVHTIWNVIRV